MGRYGKQEDTWYGQERSFGEEVTWHGDDDAAQ